MALQTAGWIAAQPGRDRAWALMLARESRELLRGTHAPGLADRALILLIQVLIDLNATDEAEQHLSEAAALITGPETDLANAVDTFRGDIALALGDGPAALAFFAASLRRAGRRGDGIQIVNDATSVAQALALAGRPDAALEAAGAAVALVTNSGYTERLDDIDNVIAAARITVGPSAERFITRGRHLPPGELVARIVALAETN